MAYVKTLTETTPAQSEFARIGASRIRDLTQAIEERLNSVFVNAEADPLVLKPDTVGTSQLQADSVGQNELAPSSVGTLELIDANITEPKYATDSVSQRALANASVGAPELIDDAVTNTKVADGAVDVVHLTADARTKLTKRVLLGNFAFAGTTIAAGASIIRQSATGVAIAGQIIAVWSSHPLLINLTDSLVFAAAAITAFAQTGQYGLAIHNVSAALLDLTGYSVDVYMLVDP